MDNWQDNRPCRLEQLMEIFAKHAERLVPLKGFRKFILAIKK